MSNHRFNHSSLHTLLYHILVIPLHPALVAVDTPAVTVHLSDRLVDELVRGPVRRDDRLGRVASEVGMQQRQADADDAEAGLDGAPDVEGPGAALPGGPVVQLHDAGDGGAGGKVSGNLWVRFRGGVK